ncbi:MAG: ribosomal-processing cysteine protease Prp [Lachnospiraceae bacterium]|nr:ribosomal-processing cysteine protease Prp [Lachnospiraceae bacterium]
MIRVSFKHDDTGCPTAFKCEGHAGSAAKGKDIICASVSVLTINAVNSVETLTNDAFDLDTDEGRGYMYFSFKEQPSDEAKLLMRSLELGIKGIIDDNGNRFITLVEWEV